MIKDYLVSLPEDAFYSNKTDEYMNENASLAILEKLNNVISLITIRKFHANIESTTRKTS